MKKNLLAVAILLLGGSGSQHLLAQSLDSQFTPPSMYGVGTVNNAIEQPDGKRLVIGDFRRANGTSTGTLVRLTATGALDQAFQQNLGSLSNAYKVALQANGQMLVTTLSTTPITAGGITRNSAIRLNADGTGDASFSLGTGISNATSLVYIDNMLQLPSGKIIITGAFDHINGVAANNIARLNSDGSLDTTFNSGMGSDEEIESVVLLPNGQLLIGGYFTTYNGSPVNGLARLNTDGTRDASFITPLGQYDEASNIAVQPDGRVLVSGSLSVSGTRGIIRLQTNGSLDNTFAPAATTLYSTYSYYGNAFELQPDGKIVGISTTGVSSGGGAASRVFRLNSDGTLDAGFLVGTGPNAMPRSVTLLASGKILVSGGFTNFNGTLDRNLIQLNSTGTIDATFQPVIQSLGTISSVALQPDGKMVVGGSFTEINGQLMRRLARVNTDGTLDAAFAGNTAFDTNPSSLALQPDGKVLASSLDKMLRFLPTGAADNSFAVDFTGSQLTRTLLQPDGKILVAATSAIRLNGSTTNSLVVRLQANGTQDATFATVAPGTNSNTNSLHTIYAMGLQPNGKILLGDGYYGTQGGFKAAIMRLDSNGAIDATFNRSEFTLTQQPSVIYALVTQPDGKILVGGNFDTNWSTTRRSLSRLNADGTLDTGFTPPAITGYINSLLVQPNNRILLGGTFTSAGLPTNLARVLANGQADATFGSTVVPNSTVRALMVQPDGKLVVGGSFSVLSGQTSVGLARIVSANVLHVQAPQAVAARTQAWPVPAHTTLTVAPDANAHPQALDLLDALGRAVRHLELNGAAPASLALDNLPAGTYLLRVTYAEGDVTRRVQVQ
ncbi:T9SS type A sorting domain-containing protein [Microvirga sp. STS02]|uniref:T9SS type A sorting domain-containing protein n=1 Tax=Hymenobacter negativus TaxID=2795026 RepID=UPI0018DEB977|nr:MULTISPECIES: T9SS type A sorting domain-containing protein [Bacteria]MBH8569283.1 T9SS type A sorting domain-containing protein [Hymenobacter negativus]MBR7209018.1 T9SS type A sorting domain-containing protein [Microvirga sp. STS02]